VVAIRLRTSNELDVFDPRDEAEWPKDTGTSPQYTVPPDSSYNTQNEMYINIIYHEKIHRAVVLDAIGPKVGCAKFPPKGYSTTFDDSGANPHYLN